MRWGRRRDPEFERANSAVHETLTGTVRRQEFTGGAITVDTATGRRSVSYI